MVVSLSPVSRDLNTAVTSSSSLLVNISGWFVVVLVILTVVVCFFSSKPSSSNCFWPKVVMMTGCRVVQQIVVTE